MEYNYEDFKYWVEDLVLHSKNNFTYETDHYMCSFKLGKGEVSMDLMMSHIKVHDFNYVSHLMVLEIIKSEEILKFYKNDLKRKDRVKKINKILNSNV